MPMRFSVLLLLVVALGCSGEELITQRPRIEIAPAVDTGQSAATNPATLDLGQVPLFGVETARFTVRNVGTARLDITGIEEASAANGTFTIVAFPERLGPAESGELIVDFSPGADGVIGEGSFVVQSNDDEAGTNNQFVVRGEGLFVGTPTLEVCYNGACYPGDGDCAEGSCTLPPLSFGNVPLEGTGSQVVTLRNVPMDGTCLAPPNSPECTKVCQLTVAQDPSGANVGFGLETASAFSIAGTVALPFVVDVPLDGCDVLAEQQALIRVTAGTTEDTVEDTLVIETNDPAATLVRIPLSATIREAPTAVATLRACDIANPDLPCSIENETRPLDRFFLDGSSSFDPDGLAIVRYAWEVLET
ncbi:MAG: choice-of-anchor D domain-containing protein, partial [Myxococcota bacterium]